MDAKARFKSLREKYRRELLIIEKLERSGAPASSRPVWPLMSFFKFMYKCGGEQQRSTTSNISQETQSSQASEVSTYNLNDSDEENIVIQLEEEENTFQLTEQMANTPSTRVKKHKGKPVPAEASNVNTELKQIDNILVDVSAAINNLNNPKRGNPDRYDLFSQYMASELKNIGEPHSSILMEEMQMAMIKYKRNIRANMSAF